LHAGAVIGSDGFGYVTEKGKRWKFPQAGQVSIGNDVEIGANTTIDRGSLDCTEISAGVKIDNLVHVAHNVRIGEKHGDRRATGISGSAVIGRDVLAFGGQVGLGDHCQIEDGAVIGAQPASCQERQFAADRSLGDSRASTPKIQRSIRVVCSPARTGGNV